MRIDPHGQIVDFLAHTVVSRYAGQAHCAAVVERKERVVFRTAGNGLVGRREDPPRGDGEAAVIVVADIHRPVKHNGLPYISAQFIGRPRLGIGNGDMYLCADLYGKQRCHTENKYLLYLSHLLIDFYKPAKIHIFSELCKYRLFLIQKRDCLTCIGNLFSICFVYYFTSSASTSSIL